MTMIFDFLKKIFRWVDEGSKKRKASEDCSFEEEYATPKRFKSNCNIAHTMEPYYIDDSDDDDIICLGEQKCSPVRPCTQLNGTHKKQPQSYEYYKVTSPSCKSTCTQLHHSKSSMEHFFHHKHRMADTCHKSPTLSKTNQLKEKYQYEEMLQNLLPNRIQVLDKHVEYTSIPKPIEVIDLEKQSELATSNKIQSSVTNTSKTMTAPYRHRGCTSNCTRIDKEKVPIFDYNEKSITSRYMQPDKVITIDRPSTSGLVKPPSTKLPVKVVATNSLRDELAAKAVMRQDFIPQVTKRYNERIEQRHREAEELKKMTCVLSKHNRYAREAALEEQLARSMKLYLSVLDDRDEQVEPALPALTDEMLREVRNAIAPGSPGEVLAEGFGLRITRKDLYTLADLNWLNDEVINFYMNLLIARGTSLDKYPKVHAMNTFFYPKLLSGGHSSLKRWTRKIDIFAQDLMVVPIHLDIHWCMSIVDFRDKTIIYYDSMGSSNPKCLAALKQYLQDESLDKKKQPYNMNDWKLQSAKNIPQQMNGSDCGVFSCMFAEYVCANKKITFTQDDMPYFRNKMVYEILKGKLL
ncbi:sentrin-specific protease 1 [Monomorium pharaonis]|uniref:sentrin-specific protease 1 n=1 Tax=Monomorium pharaonis TaxID=307658 RepID=UPI00063FA620|nr:sentrin-specific protease 1 [Monomorium pharaonis]XP_012537439.1 sentrin-specific protease 1 [Monomorium pharaonis]XP_012537440.1 sentrin-specific protease 1 [Monomorium pharaonis]XP_028048511.1 sentrin-specific protease 1 [Monomorium pharaonis]